MAQLCYYTAGAVGKLRGSVLERLDWYYHPAQPYPQTLSIAIRQSRLPTPDLTTLIVNPTRPSRVDGENALKVYQALSELTPHQASDERLWVYLCHQVCPEYVAGRWLTNRPSSTERAVHVVRNHFFAVGNRALIRDNGLSRLWWLGKIANEVDSENPGGFLTILLHRQDVRSALIERPSVSMNRRVLRLVYQEMQQHWANGGRIFEREIFRSWMRALNRRGGVILLDALPDKALADLVHDEAERALA